MRTNRGEETKQAQRQKRQINSETEQLNDDI